MPRNSRGSLGGTPLARASTVARRSRSGRRGAATFETLWVVIVFSLPTLALLSALGVRQLAEYRAARSYMLQSFP